MMMRKLLPFVVLALMAVNARAQLIAEKDWTGGFVGDYPMWGMFAEGQEGGVTSDAEGVAITVGTKTGQLWQPMYTILEGFDLFENGNYTVTIVAKFPCDGQLQINMGNWSNNYQYDFPVKATGDFQEITCSFPEFPCNVQDAHVLFECGDFAGTTIVKKVQVYNENGDDPQLIGEYTIAEKDWTGGFEGDYPMWAQFAEGQKGGVTSDAEGVAITFDTKTGQLWQPQVIILDGFDLIMDGNYIVTIVAKFPCDGELQINMGDWSGNLQYKFPVKATGDFQEITCEFPEFQFNAQDAHVLFRCGDFKGTTIVKSVKISRLFNDDDPTISGNCGQNVNYVFDKSTHKLTISGTGAMADYSYPDEAPWSSYAYAIKAIEIGSGVTSIGQNAFSGCSGLTSVAIPNSVTSINFLAFLNCTSLTSVTIPNSMTSIGGLAFGRCSSLTSVTIPNSVTSIGSEAFHGCSGLTSIKVESGNEKYDSRNNCNAIIETSSNTLIAGCKNTIIPNSVTSIGYAAFSGCSGLTTITIPNNVTSIGDDAFNDCSSLTSITIPNSVTHIGGGAFFGCSGLTSVTIPNSVTHIGGYAFFGCSGLTSINIPNSVTDIGGNGGNAFSGTAWYNNQPDGLVYAGKVAYKYKGNMPENTSIILKDGTLGISDDAFHGCSGLTSVTIPNSVTIIRGNAFYGCSGLTSVTIPSSVSYIESAFFGCTGLNFICLASEKTPIFCSLGNTDCQYIMPQSTFDAGIPQDITNYATYTVAPKYITVKSTTATTATLELTPIDLTGGSTGAMPYEVTMYDLKPGSSVKGSWKYGTSDQGLASIPTVTTKNPVMNVQPAKLLTKYKAGLAATVNEPDDDQHYGFEWQRNDAPSNMNPYQVKAQLYEGKIIGTLNGLDPDKYYKYRPFYKADDGTLFIGEWEVFITGDVDVFFEPETHTKEASEVTGESAQLVGSWIEGTEDTEEKGFEYWPESGANTRATGENMIRVIVDGNQTTATVDGLMAGKVYGYHSYVKTASGTTYGEDKTFKTPLPGDANDNGAVDAADIVELVNAKAGHPSASFNLKNADANADGSFTEADITATADIIMKR